MSKERRIWARVAPVAALFATAMTAAGCSSDGDKDRNPTVMTPGDPDDISCVGRRYISEGPEKPYVTVKVRDGTGEPIQPDAVRLRSQVATYETSELPYDTRAEVRIPQGVTQVVITAIKGTKQDTCPVIYYPYSTD